MFPVAGDSLFAASTDNNDTKESQTETQAAENDADAIQKAWDSYEKHLKQWFYKPDIEAARAVLAVAASHFHKEADPVWLFIVGPSSGDKTSICINSLLNLSQVYMQGDLTSKTFLSGYTGTAHPSLLHKIGSGILAFKDFTTFMEKRADEQAEISSQLREIYDGSFVKNTGKGIEIKWFGKLTIIAAATNALEAKWATKRQLGERFLQIRVDRKNGIEQAQYAQRQRGFEEHITSTTKRLAKEFFQAIPPITYPPPKLSSNQITRIAAMAEIVTHSRGAVERDPISKEIIDLPAIENSGRLAKSISALVSNHAALFRRQAISEEDMAIGARIAVNTIPSTRAAIINFVPIQGFIPLDMLQVRTGYPKSTLNRYLEDLEVLGVLSIKKNEIVANEVSLNPQMASLWAQAFDPLGLLAAQPRQSGLVVPH